MRESNTSFGGGQAGSELDPKRRSGDLPELAEANSSRYSDQSTSVMGNEQTSRHVRVMSVILLKADIHQRGLHVRLARSGHSSSDFYQRCFVSKTQFCPSFFQFSLTIGLVPLSLYTTLVEPMRATVSVGYDDT